MTITLGIREVTRNTSRAIHQAAAGETIVITEHDQPIAMLVPLPNTGNAVLDRMIRDGDLVPPTTPGGVAALLAIPAIDTGNPVDLAQAVSDDREERL
jgi:antitoxin (DNA-binding transcriptional repressor) of toxin-antitoxin stability system